MNPSPSTTTQRSLFLKKRNCKYKTLSLKCMIMNSVLITGGTGFLGVYLARYFLKQKFKVTLLDIAPLMTKDIKNKVEVANVDITNKKLVNDFFKKSKIDFIVHAAAALPIHHERKYIFDVNVNGTKNILNASLKNKVKRMVFISTTAMYGVPKHLPEKEIDPIDPIGNYGESKAEAEKLCFKYQGKGLSVNIIRPKSFLGPERLGVFTIWFEAIFNNKPVFILGNGNNLYQLLAVEDVCQAVGKTLTSNISGEIFNIGAEKFGTWRQDLTALIKHAKSRSKIIGLPVLPSQIILAILETFKLSPNVAWHYKTFPVNSYVSIEKAKKKLGFKPTKGNKDILIESYDWYKKNRKNFIGKTGMTHRTIWNFKLLDLV